MSKFYVVKDCYCPSTAPTNRLLGFLKAFKNKGAIVDAVFFIPNVEKDTLESNESIRVHHFWKFFPVKTNWIRYSLYYFIYRYVFAFKVKKGDTVLLIGCDDLVPLLASKKGVIVYQERTEHPEVVKLKVTNLERYYSACKKVSGIFAISSTLRDFYIEKGVAKEKVHVINMTVDPSRFDGLVKEEGLEYIAYTGTVSNSKDGVCDLLKAFAIVHQSHPHIKLYIIGSTPTKEDENEIFMTIEEYKIKEHVVFTGRISYLRIPQMLKNATVLALDRPNNKQAKYGFPTKLGEYLLTENPVVITKVGTISEFLTDGKTALISEDNNPIEFASKICWALDHPKEAEKIGKAGAKVAKQHFNALVEGGRLYDIIINN